MNSLPVKFFQSTNYVQSFFENRKDISNLTKPTRARYKRSTELPL